MFWNYLKSALRNLRKNKLFAVINIAGLALGLTIYVFGGLLVEYEQTHDRFFKNSARLLDLATSQQKLAECVERAGNIGMP